MSLVLKAISSEELSFVTPIDNTPADFNNTEPLAPSCAISSALVESESSILIVGAVADSMCNREAGLAVPIPTLSSPALTKSKLASPLPSTLKSTSSEDP